MSWLDNNSDPSEFEYDTVIFGGNVIDVREEKIEIMNLGLVKNKIKAITTKPIRGKKIIHAENLMVAPGFIDFNSHVDGNQYSAECLVRQGGTTTLGGLRHINGRIILI